MSADPIKSGVTMIPAYDADSARDTIRRLVPGTVKVHEVKPVGSKRSVRKNATNWFRVTWSVPGPSLPSGEINHDRMCTCSHSAYDDHNGPHCMVWGCSGMCSVQGTSPRRYAQKRKPIYR